MLEAEPKTTIEEKRLAPPAADQTLVRALRGRRGELTRADAVAASGLPTHVVDESLERLLKKYRSRLAVTEEGELLYSFDPSFSPRDRPSFAERMRAFGRRAARVGMWLFKVWIAVTLVAYVVAFIVLLIASAMSGRDDRRRGRGDGGLGLLWLFIWPDMTRGYHGPRDSWGRPVRRVARGKKKPFLQSVFDFVFGPPRPPADDLADEREILGWLRANDGRLTATDLVEMFGWSYRRAEEEATRLLVDYDGDPEVTEEGVLVYSFPKLLKTAGTEIERPSGKRAWERLETRPVMTANTRAMDVLIGAFAAFNLVVSFFAADLARARLGLAGPEWRFFLTAFPLSFFGIFLAIPSIRLLARRIGDRGRAQRNARKELLRNVFAANGAALPLEQYRALASPFEGDIGFDEKTNEPIITFPRVREEREARRRFVSGVDVPSERRLGPVIFGKGEEPN